MGVAAQMIHWPRGLIDRLLARGLQIVRFDNRDSGHSTHMADAPAPDLPAAFAGDLSSASYTLSDMAADTIGLLDALGLDRAHLVGASLGGAIAQTAAMEHPDRVISLTTMMSTTGAPDVGQAHPTTLRAIFTPASTRDAVMERAVRSIPYTGSPLFPSDPDEVAARAGEAWDRDHDTVAPARQGIASIASGDRTAALRSLRLPTLVVHGLADTVCDPSGGRATAAAIFGAELLLIDGMGHNLPAGIWDELADAISAVVQRGEAARQKVAHLPSRITQA